MVVLQRIYLIKPFPAKVIHPSPLKVNYLTMLTITIVNYIINYIRRFVINFFYFLFNLCRGKFSANAGIFDSEAVEG